MARNSLVFGLLILALLASPADAQNCPTTGLPNQLANGSVADASQVMANFGYLGVTCGASQSSPSFTGVATFGTTSTAGQLVVVAPNTATTGTFYGISLTGAQSAADSGTYYGLNLNPTYTATGTLGTMFGASAQPVNSSSGTVTTMYGERDEPQNSSSGTVSTMRASYLEPLNSGSGSVGTMYGVESLPVDESSFSGSYGTTTMYGIYSKPALEASANVEYMYALYGNCQNSGTGTVTTCYELYLDTPAGSGSITNTYGIYQTGSATTNYLAGKLGIGTASPSQTLEVNGEVKVDTFGSATATAVCENAGVLSTCSSSIRYKENIKDAPFGLDDVMQMRPVTFKWKGRDENDFGLIAEEMAKIDPLFVTYQNGKIEGVKYGQLTAVLIGAIKQLKAANDQQEHELSSLKNENAALKASLTVIDERLSALEAKSANHSASYERPHSHTQGVKKGG